MTDEEAPTGWRREELARPPRTSRLPWLAIGAVATATVVAATTLVLGIGDTLSSRDRSAGRLLPLQAASPSATASPSGTPAPEPPPPEPEPEPTTAEPEPSKPEDPPGTNVHDALLRLRHAVHEGVAAGDVRDDVGLDLTNVINGMLDGGGRAAGTSPSSSTRSPPGPARAASRAAARGSCTSSSTTPRSRRTPRTAAPR
ncbi:hypothetical protein [Actinomadura madurae]|uniref:hypothetical protein n=1 Tax=Actinomadura madurae TaxID=1993 RepID=UPI0020D21C91|nr:hypothetical protein [Actinomadura madurae]MCP9979584.1 hypothetical protein [Actinomadura madurae]MCQ0008887.1 hypothetical protein [Actinomadura madurae]MCQ0015793.1 hypothetical protein [Actinomadura madurae]